MMYTSTGLSTSRALLSLLLLLHLPSAIVHAQSVSVVTVTAPRATHAPSFVDDGDFIASVLNSTNFYRYEHGAEPLAWNNSLQQYAQNWTEDCQYSHSGGPFGENIAQGYQSAQLSIEAWGNERAEYDFSNPGYADQTGHFTQLVWTGSRTLGCGRKYCTTGVGGWYLVCEYWPPGNVLGSFAQYVHAQVNDGRGYYFQNCTQTGNCTALPAGEGDDGGTSPSATPTPTAGSKAGGKSDSSKIIVGPVMALIVIAATMLSLWEPYLHLDEVS